MKPLSAVGSLLGWHAVLFTLVASAMAGSLVGMTFVLTRRKTFGSRIPFGPYIVLGALVWLLGGSRWWDAYFTWVMM